MLYPCGSCFIFTLNSIKFVITGDDRRMQGCSRSQAPIEPGKLVPISAYNYFYMIEIIRTVSSIIPTMHLQKTGISVLPYVLILIDGHFVTVLRQMSWNLSKIFSSSLHRWPSIAEWQLLFRFSTLFKSAFALLNKKYFIAVFH